MKQTKILYTYINSNIIKFVNNRYLLIFSVLLILFLVSIFIPSYRFSFIIYVSSFLFTWFILDDKKLSENKGLRDLQIIFFTMFIINILKEIKSFFGLVWFDTIYCSDGSENNKPKNKGFFNPKISVGLEDDSVEKMKEVSKEVGNQLSDAINKGTDKIANALVTAGVGGAAAYVVKNSALPPVAKVGLVVGASAVGSVIQRASSTDNMVKSVESVVSNLPDGHPPSPTETIFDNINTSSIGFPFDWDTWFGIDPNNYLLSLIFSLLTLNILALFFTFLVIVYLIYIYIYHNTNLELKWIETKLPTKYSNKIKILITWIVKRWNKSNYVIVIFSLILLVITLSASTYFLYSLFTNFDLYIKSYLKYMTKN